MDRGRSAYVLVEVGSVLLAVPAQAVVQAIAWPEQLDTLPRRADSAACGVFTYHGQALAMLELGRWVNVGTRADGDTAIASAQNRRALIVRAGAHALMVAIAVDAVRGLHQLSEDAVTRISHDDDEAELFHSVARFPHIDGVANVLDVERLMALARTWSVAGAGANVASHTHVCASANASGAAASYGLIAGQGCAIAFPVADLLEALPAPPLDAFQSPLTEGLCRWRGRHLPVTSVAKCFPTLAAPAMANGAVRLLAVFERDGLALGVLVDQVPAIRKFTAPADEALHAVADADGTLVHLVGMQALYARFPERELSRSERSRSERSRSDRSRSEESRFEGSRSDRSRSDRSRSAGRPFDEVGAAAIPAAQTNASSHIVFDAGGIASTPIDGIEAVLPLPALASGAAHMAWRGKAIALHDLREARVAGAARDDDTARAASTDGGTVIVVNGANGPLGLIVDAVQALVQARAGRVSRLAMAGRGQVDLLTVGAPGDQRTYSTRNLSQLAQTLG